MALISQLSAHVLGLAILAYYPSGTPSLTNVQQVSVALAFSAGALGVMFGASILFVTRKIIAREVDVYIAAGLPLSSSMRQILTYHPLRPAIWVTGSALVAGIVDFEFGLAIVVPLFLAVSFVVLLFASLGVMTYRTYTRSDFKSAGRSG